MNLTPESLNTYIVFGSKLTRSKHNLRFITNIQLKIYKKINNNNNKKDDYIIYKNSFKILVGLNKKSNLSSVFCSN